MPMPAQPFAPDSPATAGIRLHFGSRAGLIMATVQHLDRERDEAWGLMKRTGYVREVPLFSSAGRLFAGAERRADYA